MYTYRLEGITLLPSPGFGAHDAVLCQLHKDAGRDEVTATQPYVARSHPPQRLRRNRLQPHCFLRARHPDS